MQAGFRKLIVWRRAKDLAVRIYRVTSEGPLARDLGLRDQLRRAAVSVASNIAEGNERGTDRDACRYFYIAKGSIGELSTQLQIASDSFLGADLASDLMMRALIVHRINAGLPSRPSPLDPRPSNG